jgi:nitronate monooxygenase
MPDSSVDSEALYAGETALRINKIVSAQQAVNDLAP